MEEELEFGDVMTDSISFASMGQEIVITVSNGSCEAVASYALRPSDIRDTVDYLNEHLKNMRR